MNQGTRWVLLLQKNRRRKSHAWAPLKVEGIATLKNLMNKINSAPPPVTHICAFLPDIFLRISPEN